MRILNQPPLNSLADHAWQIAGGFFTHRFLPWLVLAFSLGTTCLLWLNERDHAVQELHADFLAKANAINTHIEQRMQAYEQILKGARGLFAASMSVERNEFRDYVESLQLVRNFPGTQGLGYAQIIPSTNIAEHLASMHRHGFPAYTITPAGVRDIYVPLIYIEPFFARNLRAFGYDMYTDTTHRTTMDAARDTNLPHLSSKLTLIQEDISDIQAGALIFLPVYKNGIQHDSLEQRQTHITGWVSIALRMDDLMAGILGDRAREVEVEVRDGDLKALGRGGIEAAREAVLYDPDFHSRSATPEPRFYSDTHLKIANHSWTVTVHSLPAFEAHLNQKTPLVVGITGIGMSLLLSLFTWQLLRGRTYAMQAARTLALESEKNKMLLHVASDGIYILDREGKIILTNDTLCRMLSYSAAEMRKMSVAQWNEKWTADKVKAKITELLSHPEGVVFETRFKRRDGRYVEVEVNAASVEIEGRTMLYSSVRDISQRRASEEAQRLAATVFNTVDEAVMVIGLDGKILTVNPAFSVITGYAPSEVTGHSPRMLAAGSLEFDLFNQQLDFFDELWVTMAATGKWQGEVGNRRKNGEYYVAWLSINLVYDSQNRATHYVGAFSDISERKATEEHMSFLAHYDALTELPNRTLFSDRLLQALAQAKRDKSRLALIYIDLDSFKPINDTYGHNTGDLLLKEVAQRLQECKRESDAVSRIGGDEFTLLLPSIETEHDAMVVAEKILQALVQPFILDGNSMQLSASIGIAIYPEHGSDEKLLIKHADVAMYHAKKNAPQQDGSSEVMNKIMLYRSDMLESRQGRDDVTTLRRRVDKQLKYPD